MNDILNVVLVLMGISAGYFLVQSARKVRAETRAIEERRKQ